MAEVWRRKMRKLHKLHWVYGEHRTSGTLIRGVMCLSPSTYDYVTHYCETRGYI